jgi:hypothetical protein
MMLGDSGASVFCYRDHTGLHVDCTGPANSGSARPASVVVRGYDDKEPRRRVLDGRYWLLGDAVHPMSPRTQAITEHADELAEATRNFSTTHPGNRPG